MHAGKWWQAGDLECWPIFGSVSWDYNADIVVVGSGIAGLLASIEAHEKGAGVLLIEMAESPFCGESAVCGGGMAIPGTEMQARQGIHDSPDSLYDDILAAGGGSNRKELVRLFTEHVGEAYSRLMELGGICNKVGYIGGHSVFREHQHDPMQIQRALFDQFRKRRIQSLFGKRAARFVMTPDGRRVVGIGAVDVHSGEDVMIGGKAIILATGGMCGSPEMLARYVPNLDALALCAAVGKSKEERPIGLGDGYRMAMAIGADTTHMYSVSTYTGIPHPERAGFSNRSRRPWIPSYQEGAIAVNSKGRRFIEETTSPPCEIGMRMLEQPDQTLFKVCDSRMWETITQGRAEAEVIAQGKGYLWEEDSLRKLANAAGIDPRGLQATIDRYNLFVEEGKDEDFERPIEYLEPIDRPPFVAHQNWLIALHNSGGLRVSNRLQILHVSGKPILGLFGAGEVVGGTSGEVYLTATHYPMAMTFGYLAGGRFAISEG